MLDMMLKSDLAGSMPLMERLCRLGMITSNSGRGESFFG